MAVAQATPRSVSSQEHHLVYLFGGVPKDDLDVALALPSGDLDNPTVAPVLLGQLAHTAIEQLTDFDDAGGADWCGVGFCVIHVWVGFVSVIQPDVPAC